MDKTISYPLTGSALDAGLEWDPNQSMELSKKRMMEKNRKDQDKAKLIVSFETYGLDPGLVDNFIDLCYSKNVDPVAYFRLSVDREIDQRQKQSPPPNLKH